MQNNENILHYHQFVLVLIHRVCGNLLWIYHTKWSVPHDCDSLSSVLGALCAAANKVTITKPGVTVTLNCGVKSARLLEWHHESDLILTRGGRFPTKGINRQFLDIINSITSGLKSFTVSNHTAWFSCIRLKWHCTKVVREADKSDDS